MGFSIGKFIGAVAPLVGAAFGPIGAAIGLGVSAGLAPSPALARQPVPGRAVTPQAAPLAPLSRATQVSPSPVSQRIAGFNVQRRRVGTIGGLAAGAVVGTAIDLFRGGGGNGETVGMILQQARETFGRGVTRNKIIAAAKACGIDQSAATFGISPTQVCKVIVAGGSRRRRGISAADIRRTKRTLRFVKSLRKDLKGIKA